MVAEPQRLFRVVLLGLRDGLLCELLRNFKRMHVHRLRSAISAQVWMVSIVCPAERENDGGRDEAEQREQTDQDRCIDARHQAGREA